MLIQLLPMILLGCIGFGLRQAGILNSSDAKTIGKLITTLALPAVILRALATATITPDLIYLLTVVYCLSAWFGRSGVTGRAILLKLAQTPFFWAIVLGLALNVLGWTNEVLLGLLNIAGGSFLLLVLLLLGMEFQMQLSSAGRYLLLALAKIGCGLGLGWAATQVFGLQGVEQAAVLAGAALPPSMLTLLFAQENQLDTRFVISFISAAVPLYLAIVTPLLAHLSLSP